MVGNVPSKSILRVKSTKLSYRRFVVSHKRKTAEI